MYQNGLTLGVDGVRDGQIIREWLEAASGPCSIAYGIAGLDRTGIFPRVYTATPVETTDGAAGWAIGHCIDLDDSLLLATRNFQDQDCPRWYFLKMESARRCWKAA